MTKSGQPKGAHALLRKYPDLGLLVGARFFSMAAGQIQSVAIAWHVYEKTHQQIALGYVGLSYFLPAFGLSLIAGHVADRFDRRWVLLSTVILQIVCTLSLAWIVAHPELDVLWVYGVTFLVGCARAFAGPAAQALLPSTTRLENLSGAIALSSSGAQLAMIAGPAAGGALYALTHGGPILFYIVALILVVCAILVFWIRTEARPQHHERSSFASLFYGLRYVWQRKVILGAISLDLFAVLLGGSVALLPVFARDILHVVP